MKDTKNETPEHFLEETGVETNPRASGMVPKLESLVGGKAGRSWQEAVSDPAKVAVIFTPHDVSRTADSIERMLSLDTDIYSFDGRLCRIGQTGVMTPLKHGPTARMLTENHCFYAQRESGKTEARLPSELAFRAVLDAGSWGGIRKVERIRSAPVLLKNGELLSSGFADGTLVLGQHEVEPTPRQPTQLDATRAAKSLIGLLENFPLSNEGRSAWLGFLLTLVGREMIDGPCPMFLFSANQAGVGKSLLVELACLIASKKPPSLMSLPPDRNEAQKRFTAALSSGVLCTNIDNVYGGAPLSDPTLDAILTCTEFSYREMGTHRAKTVPARCIWTVTGNGLQTSSDLSRRTIRIEMQSPCEAPSDRDLPDIRALVKGRQPTLYGLAVTVIRAWQRSQLKSPYSYGSFENWSQLVDGAVVYAAGASIVQNQQVVRRSHDDGRDSLRLFLRLLATAYPQGATSATLCAAFPWQSQPTDTAKTFEGRSTLEGISGRGYSPRSLGNFLKGVVGRVVDGVALEAQKNRDGVSVWFSLSGKSVVGDPAVPPEPAVQKETGAGSAGCAGSSYTENPQRVFPNASESLEAHVSLYRGTMNGGAE
jgi:hypothetical protein